MKFNQRPNVFGRRLVPRQTSSVRDEFFKEMVNKDIDDREDAMPKIEDLRARMGSLKPHIQKVLREIASAMEKSLDLRQLGIQRYANSTAIVHGQLLNAQDQLEVQG
jgi:hypothetical protein